MTTTQNWKQQSLQRSVQWTGHPHQTPAAAAAAARMTSSPTSSHSHRSLPLLLMRAAYAVDQNRRQVREPTNLRSDWPTSHQPSTRSQRTLHNCLIGLLSGFECQRQINPVLNKRVRPLRGRPLWGRPCSPYLYYGNFVFRTS